MRLSQWVSLLKQKPFSPQPGILLGRKGQAPLGADSDSSKTEERSITKLNWAQRVSHSRLTVGQVTVGQATVGQDAGRNYYEFNSF